MPPLLIAFLGTVICSTAVVAQPHHPQTISSQLFEYVRGSNGVELCTTGAVDVCVENGNTFRFDMNRYRLFGTIAPSDPNATCDSEAARYWVGMEMMMGFIPKYRLNLKYHGYDDDGTALVDVETSDGDLATLLFQGGMLEETGGAWC